MCKVLREIQRRITCEPQGTILNPKCKCLMWINVGVDEEMKVFIEEVGFGLGHEG